MRESVVRAVAIVVFAASVITACSDNSGNKSSSTTRPGATLPQGVTGATNVPNDVPNDPTKRANVQLASCARAADGWSASGKAVNPNDAAVTYTVTVFFTSSAATVLSVADTHVTVAGHKTDDWSVTAKFAAPEGTNCVLRGVG